MNIAKLMIPKLYTAFLHENDTIRQGLECFTHHGYTAIPVLNEHEQYIGSITEGDFLRHVLATGAPPTSRPRSATASRALSAATSAPPWPIDADGAEVVAATLDQNFVPIVDGPRHALRHTHT